MRITRVHNICRFKKDGNLYAADIDIGKVVRIDKILWEMLDLIEETDIYGKAKERLSDKFSGEEIEDGFRKLKKLIGLGLFVSEEISAKKGERLSLLITHSVIGEMAGIRAKLNHYYLLKSLSQKADLFISLPEVWNVDLESEDIKVAPFKVGTSESQAKFIPQECDCLLILSPSSREEKIFFRYGDLPVITYVYSDLLGSIYSINEILGRYAALRDYDAMVLDSSWIRGFLGRLLGNSSGLKLIPPGIDLERFSPIRGAKKRLSEALGDPEILNKPIIGVEVGWPRYRFVELILGLCEHNKELLFLVFDPLWEGERAGIPDNVRGFGIWTDKDVDISPLVFSALDILLFPAVPGASSTLLLEIMGCKVPVLSFGPFKPEEIMGAGDFIETGSFPLRWDDSLIAEISSGIKRLLDDGSRRREMADKARRIASRFSWDRTADMLLDLMQDLVERKGRKPWSKLMEPKPLFARKYDKATDRVMTRAFLMPYLLELDLPTGIEIGLSEEHTRAEIKAILDHMSK